MPTKIITFFEDSVPVSGWTEGFYIPGVDLSAVPALISAWLPLRMAISPSSLICLGWRASVVGTKKKYYSGQFTASNTGTFNAETEMTEPWTALLIQFVALFRIHVSKFFHGIPQTQVVGGVYTPTAPYITAVSALANWYLANANLYAKDPANPGAGKQLWTPDNFIPKRVTEHKIGRPFDLLRGRRLAV